jgi:hypothetical protein
MSVSLVSAPAQEPDAQELDTQDGDSQETLELLEGRALQVSITARIIEDGEETVWNMDLTRVTISGRAVTVRLEGSNVVVVANFTPYREDDNSVLLVAQGQTWVTGADDDERVTYRTALKSLPMRLGEPVVFLPLGDRPIDVNIDTEDYGVFNIELEVNVEPYTAKNN